MPWVGGGEGGGWEGGVCGEVLVEGCWGEGRGCDGCSGLGRVGRGCDDVGKEKVALHEHGCRLLRVQLHLHLRFKCYNFQ